MKAAWTPEEARTERQRESRALARELAAELRFTDLAAQLKDAAHAAARDAGRALAAAPVPAA